MRRFDLATDEVFERFYASNKKVGRDRRKDNCRRHEITRFLHRCRAGGGQFGYLSFYFLEFMGRDIASRFTLTHGGRYHELECVYDEEFSEYAPGHLIINEILSDCMRRGFYEISFSGHSSEFKERWTSETHPHSNLYVFRNNLYGRALYAAKYTIRPCINKMKEVMNLKANGDKSQS